MNGQRFGVFLGWVDVVVCIVKVVVIVFVVLQLKEWMEIHELDILACAVDATCVAGGIFLVNAILVLVNFSRGR
jgi:hypothetical protein